MTKQYDNFADLITFTRASTGTYLDSDGLLKTASTNVPRIEYDANGNRKGLLIEEARTNLLRYSEDFTQAIWLKINTGTGVLPVVTANNAEAPDGTLTADRVDFDRGAGNASSDRSYLNFSPITTVVSSVYTGSVFIKAVSSSDVGKQLAVRHVGSGAYTVVTLTASWQRIQATETAASTSSFFNIETRGTFSADNQVSALIWGAQLEAGSFPTSYIPTAGSTATRSADVASIPTSAFGYNQKAGTVVCEFEYQYAIGGGFVRPWELGSTSTAINRINVFTSSSSGNLSATAISNNVSVASFGLLAAPPSPVGGRVAFAFAENNFAVCINGGTVLNDNDGTMTPSVPRDTLKIGGAVAVTNANINGHIKSIQYYPRRLSNAQLQRLTA